MPKALLVYATRTGQSQNIAGSAKASTTAIYPKIRIWTTPSMGEEPRFNSPSFQWPTKKKASYSIRISASRNFSRDVIERHGIPYAIFIYTLGKHLIELLITLFCTYRFHFGLLL